MKFSVIKKDLNGTEIENLGEKTIEEVEALAKTFIPDVFPSTAAVSQAIRVIKAEGADDWFVPGPAVINIRRVEE